MVFCDYLQQFADGGAILDDVDRTPCTIEEGPGRVDAHGAIERSQHLRHGDATVLRTFATCGAGADRLAHAHAATGDERRHDRRPVISARSLVDARGTA